MVFAAPVFTVPVPVFTVPIPVFAVPVPIFTVPVPIFTVPVPIFIVPVPVFTVPVQVFTVPVQIFTLPVPLQIFTVPVPFFTVPVPVFTVPVPIFTVPTHAKEHSADLLYRVPYRSDNKLGICRSESYLHPENFHLHFHCASFHEPNRHFTALHRDRTCRCCSHESAKDFGSSDGSLFTLLGAEWLSLSQISRNLPLTDRQLTDWRSVPTDTAHTQPSIPHVTAVRCPNARHNAVCCYLSANCRIDNL